MSTTRTSIAGLRPFARPSGSRMPRAEWARTVGLVSLGLVPLAAGGVRLERLLTGAEPADSFQALHAVPLTVHIVGATAFALLGALQFAPTLRMRRPGLHRVLGTLLVPAGLAAAATGVTMRLQHEPGSHAFLVGLVQMPFALLWILALLRSVAALRQGDYARHGAWMTRAYAIGLAASTQFLLFLPWLLFAELPGGVVGALTLGAGFAVNLVLAEVQLRRRRTRGNGEP
jgi:uncharacterized membrane protein